MEKDVLVGIPAVDFTLPDQNGNPVTLADYRGRNVIVAFYPADFSPVCTTELALVQEVLDDIHGRHAELLGISVDGVYCHRAFAERNHITFPLLADFWPHGAVAERYGVFRDDDGFSDRALFFVDAEGLLQGSWIAEEPGIAPGLNVIFDGLEQLRAEQARHAG